LTQGVTGVQRYARETLACLDTLLAQPGTHSPWNRMVVLAPKGTRNPGLHHIGFETTGRLQGHAWEQIDLAWRARNGLLFTFGFTGPLLHPWQITTVHDAAVVRIPQAYTTKFRLWYTFMVRWLVKHASVTIAVSQFSKQEAVDCFGAQVSQVAVSTEGWQHLERIQADPRILDQHQLRGVPYVLAVSSATPNKNFGAIVKALSLMGPQAPRLVVAGASNLQIFQQANDCAEHTTKLGYVTDAELKALYQHAACFVFPSFYEGFGIPPLEAMSCGCPVIASNAPAIQEVCADAAMYFDPHSAQQLANQMATFFSNANLRHQMVKSGLARSSQFSWQESARLHLDIFSRAHTDHLGSK
jgi:glycosyltransferase involved in cell wall biosynthesis